MFKDCECDICVRGRRWNSILKTNELDKIHALVEELRGIIFNIEADNNYYHAIIDGSWPSAKDILTRALNRCAQKSKQSNLGDPSSPGPALGVGWGVRK